MESVGWGWEDAEGGGAIHPFPEDLGFMADRSCFRSRISPILYARWKWMSKPLGTGGVINCVGHLRESALRRSLFLEVVGLQGVTTKLGFGKECVLDYSAISVCKARPTKRR